MSKTLEKLKAAGKVALWIDFRRNSLKDLSGNGNDIIAANLTTSWKNTKFGRGVYASESGGNFQVADSASLRVLSGYLLIFGQIEKHGTNGRLISKRDGGGTQWEIYLSSTAITLYSGIGGSSKTYNIGGHNMVGARILESGAPTFYIDGVNIGDGASYSFTEDDADLYIGGFYIAPNGFGNAITQVVILNDHTITDEQIADIYEEYMQERGQLESPTSNFPMIKAEDTTSSNVIDLDMVTKTGDGKMADLSGNGNHGAIAAETVSIKDGIDFQSTSAKITVTQSSSINDLTTESYEFVLNLHTSGASNAGRILDKGAMLLYQGTNKLLFWRNRATTAGTWVNTNSDFIYGDDKKYHVILTYDGSSTENNPIMYVNGNPVALTELTTPVGNLSTDAANNLAIGNGISLARNMGGFLYYMRVYNAVLTPTEVATKYAEYAKTLKFRQSMEDIPPTLANLTAANDRIGLTDFRISTGQWKVSEDSNSKKWIENVSAGVAYIESTKAYGTWTFDLYKGLDAGISDVLVIADTKGGASTSGQDGYIFRFDDGERVAMGESVNGTPSFTSYTAASYMAIQTTYNCAVTRRYDGQFSYYIKGGAYTTWTLVDTSGGAGSNPFTDATATTSNYLCIDLDAGDKFSNLRMHEGVLTSAQLAELYPN